MNYYLDDQKKEQIKQLTKEEVGFRVDSGYRFIDRVVGGFRAGNVYLVGGLEKSGKSSLLFGMTDHLIKSGEKIAFVDTELSFKEFINKLIAVSEDKTIASIEGMSEEEKKRWAEAVLGHSITYCGRAEISNIETKLLDFNKVMGQLKICIEEKIRVVIIDNLTTFANQSGDKKGWEILADCIDKLVSFAKRERIVVFVVIHTRPELVLSEMPHNIRAYIKADEPEKIFSESGTFIRRPSLASVYGGGKALSQISGSILIWRPFQKYQRSDLSEMTQIILDSFRHSPSGVGIRMRFLGSRGKFEEQELNFEEKKEINNAQT